MRMSGLSSDVCASDLLGSAGPLTRESDGLCCGPSPDADLSISGLLCQSSLFSHRRHAMCVEAPGALSGAGPSRIPAELATFFAISAKWLLSADEQIALLCSPGRPTFFQWKKAGGT